MADFTSTTSASWTPAVWSPIYTETYRSNTVNVPLLDHRWEPEIGPGKGKLVNIPGFTQNNTARNRGAGTGTFGTPASTTFDAATEAQVQLIIDRYYYKAWRAGVELVPQMMPEYPSLINNIGHPKALALQVDADVASDSTNGFDSFTTIEGVDNVDITEDVIIASETDINNVNAPTANRYFVYSPATRGSLLKIESLRSTLYNASIGNIDGKMGLGYSGSFLSFEATYTSNNLKAGTAGKENAVFHKEAIAYAEQLQVQTRKSENIQDGNYDQYITYMTCGFKKIKDTAGVLVRGK